MKSNLLKAERLRRGWTQANVAAAVGVDAKTVGRWERGKGVPYPYFREQLCALFGKTAEQLGLLSVYKDTTVDDDAPLGVQCMAPESAMPAPCLADPSIPLSLQGATSLVGRHGVLMEMKERLLAGEDIVVTAVDSSPGIGKTALATALVMDLEVRDHFCDGILWAGLGPRPNVLGHLTRWGMLLGVIPSQVDNIGSREDWKRALRAAIGTRRLLLIIDDACTVEDALSLQIGGRACAYLLTTSLPQVASTFAQEEPIFVPQLTEAESLVLLASFVPELVEQDLQGAQALVQAVGGSPLALTLMGKYLGFTKQPWPLHNSLMEFYDPEKDLEGSIPTLSGQFSASLAQSIPVNLHTIIALCDQSLSPQAHAALCALAVFPPQPKSFSQEAALAVCQQPGETLDMLLAVGLLETCGPGRYSWHQAVAEYARAQRDALATSRHLTTSVMRDAQESEPNRPLPALSWAQSLWKSSPSPVESTSTLQPFRHLFFRPSLILSVILLTILVINVIVLACAEQLYLGRTLPASNSGGATSTARQSMTSATSAQGITSKDSGFSPKNLCQGRNPINPNPQNGPTGPLGQALPSAEYNNQSDGSDVYCGTTPPKNPYYQDTNDPNYQPGNDESDQFEIAGQLTKSNLDEYCQTTLGVSGGPTGGGAQRDGDNVYSWSCHRRWGDRGIPIEMNNVCQQQFGPEATQSRLNYYWSGKSQMWECLSQAESLGGIELDSYCQDVKDKSGKNYSNAKWGSTAYDIFCQAKNSKSDKSGTGGNSVKFDTMLDACEWQYPQYQYVIDVLINYLDTTSWECWGAPS
jgi:transcriptional regulator with XRE-family HTH domain